MKTLSDMLPKNSRRDGRPSAAGELALTKAYNAFRRGRATSDESDLIMTDLAIFSGYYNTTPSDLPAEQLKHAEGQRSVYGRILSFINPPAAELEELEAAVKREMHAMSPSQQR